MGQQTIEGVDLQALARWMDDQGLPGGPLERVELLGGGTQNILLRFERGGRGYVLRRPPAHKRTNSDETMRREARVLRTERERRLEGTLRLLDGEVGEIAQGRSVPVTTRDAWGASATAFVEARQGFRVRPRVLGNGRVRIEIDPMDAQVDAAGRTRFAGASTTVEVRPGEEMVIGSLGERRDAGERGLRVLSTDRRGEERVLLLRVEVEPEP